MSAGTLWTTTDSSIGKGLQAAAAYGGVKVDISKEYKHFEDNKKPAYLSKFPLGKIPAWEGADGFLLSEGAAIVRYIASLAPNSGLLGNDAKAAALVDQWISFAGTEILSYSQTSLLLVKGILTPYSKGIHAHCTDYLIRSLKVLNEHLLSQTFVVGERPTAADFYLCGTIRYACSVSFDAELRKQFPNVLRYYETVTNQPSVKGIFGQTEYLEKALQYVAPKKEEKEKPKKVEKKVEKKAEKPKADEEEDDDRPPEPKPKHPLDTLPKLGFIEDLKRTYSNNETRGAGGALEWYYETVNNEENKGQFSEWRVDYKYNEELTQIFMSSNLVGGFNNRLEGSRKYFMGSLGVLGKTNDSVISGVFIVRGQDVKPVVDVSPDADVYEFTKLDLSKEEDKKFFEAALAWDLELNGKTWADGKALK